MSYPPRPNILWITTDQQRHDALGINGNPMLQTPNLDALAGAGMNFTRAYSTCPVCIPARRSWYTGQHCTTHGMVTYRDGCTFDPAWTLPQLMRESGYQTQLVGKKHLHPQRKRYGFDHQLLSESPSWRPDSPTMKHNDYLEWLFERGQNHDTTFHGVDGNGRMARPFALEEQYHPNTWLVREAADFLTRWRDPTMPWFLHLSFWAPHPPLVPPQVYYDRYREVCAGYAPDIGEWVPRFEEPWRPRHPTSATGPFPRREIANAAAGYYGLVDHVDSCINYLLMRYREYMTDRANDPILVLFTSDHGEMLGDHHLFRKSLPYEGSSHVPFFISGLNFDLPRAESEALVCLEDIAPTLLDLVGLEVPGDLGPLDGKSLAPILRGASQEVRQTLYSEIQGPGGKMHWLIEGPWKYIWFQKTNEEQLFHLHDDPRELRDVSGEVDADVLKTFREKLRAHLAGREQRDHWIGPAVYPFNPADCTPCANRPPRALWG